jgi:hypothetical protein
MTQARSRANWSGVPSLTGLWLEAMLRLIAMLWSNLALFAGMLLSRLSRECHTDVAPHRLPRRDREPIQEPDPAGPTGLSSTSRLLNRSSSGKARSAASRGSLFESQRDSHRSPRSSNRDPRHKAGDDTLRGQWTSIQRRPIQSHNASHPAPVVLVVVMTSRWW